MNISILSFAFPPSNYPVSKRMYGLYVSLLKSGHKIQIVTTNQMRFNKIFSYSDQDYNDCIRININSNFRLIGFLKYFFFSIYHIQKNKPDLLISSSGRLGSLLIAFFLKKFFKIKYVADYRDIFSSNFKELYLNKLFFLKYIIFNFIFFLEKITLNNAIHVNVVSYGILNYYNKRNINTNNWSVIYNGFDDNLVNQKLNFRETKIKKRYPSKKISIIYAGNIGFGQGLENTILKLSTLDKNKFHFQIYGSGIGKKKLAETLKSKKIKHIEVLNPLDSNKITNILNSADILYFQLNNKHSLNYAIPSKIFDYLYFRKPIFGLTNKQNHDEIKKISKNIFLYAYEDINKMVIDLNNLDIDSLKINKENIKRYSISFQMSKLCNIINKLQ